jgi:hypothetical protein
MFVAQILNYQNIYKFKILGEGVMAPTHTKLSFILLFSR